MKLLRIGCVYGILFILLVLPSCSKGQNPVNPESGQTTDASDSLAVVSESEANRTIIAVYDVEIDPATQHFTITPSDRISAFHIPLRYYYPDVLHVDIHWVPFWAYIALAHPLPGSGIDVFDPRVIALLPEKSGCNFNYPNLNVTGNCKTVGNPDGYTKLFDYLDPRFQGNTNPFKAYFTDRPNRRWPSTGATYDGHMWDINLDGLYRPVQFKLVVDVSTNFPHPPQPGIDNAPEPVQIDATVDPGLTPDGGSAPITVTLIDWQGISGIGGVKAESPALFNGIVNLTYSGPGQNPNEYIYSGTITNELHAPVGEYTFLVATWDQNTNIYMYDEFKAYVQEDIVFNPIDVTPPWLNITPMDIAVDGNYAYIAAGVNDFHIFNVEDPYNPVWVSWVKTTEYAGNLCISNGYAYVACGNTGYQLEFGLNIIDIDPPESAHLVKYVATPSPANQVHVCNGYAYITYHRSMAIIDIDPPESASTIKIVDMPYYTDGIYAANGYAYVATYDEGLQIVDIDPPESAFIYKAIDTPADAVDVYVDNGYAYVVDWGGDFLIIDIDPLDSAYVVKKVPVSTTNVFISNGYAYCSSGAGQVAIIDIDPPESAYLAKTIDTPGNVRFVYESNGYAFVADTQDWQIIDIDPLETAFVVSTRIMPCYASCVAYCKNRAYVATYLGLMIMDVTQPESAYIMKIMNPPFWPSCICISDGYAYVMAGLSYGHQGLYIIDITSPDSAFIAKIVEINSYQDIHDIHVSNGYAYVTAEDDGLFIIDIDPPDSAHFVNGLTVYDEWNYVHVQNDYAYVTDYWGGLNIIDINPPESAYIVTSYSGGDQGVYVAGSYAYVLYSGISSYLRIIDIDPPLLVNLVNRLELPNEPWDLCVVNGYAYIADGVGGLQIADISPPENAQIVSSIDTPGTLQSVDVSGQYAYLANDDGGFRIIKLW